jgi:hypothetical protein
VTSKRLPRAEKDLFSRHSQRIARALQVRELDFYGYAVLSFLVDVIELPGRSGEATYTLAGLAEAVGWPLEPEILRRRLHRLRRERWIDFDDPRRGPEAAWIFRLTGAALDAKRAASPANFHPGIPSRVETNSTRQSDTQAASPQRKSVSDPLEFPTAPLPLEEKRERGDRQRGNLENVGVETTSRAREATRDDDKDASPDLLEENPFPPGGGYELEDRGDRGALPRQPPLDESLGTASLAELHHRHTRDEL